MNHPNIQYCSIESRVTRVFHQTLLKTIFIALSPFKVKPPHSPDNRLHWTLIDCLTKVVAHYNSSIPPPSPSSLDLPLSVLNTAQNPHSQRMEDPDAPRLWVNVKREDHPLLVRSPPKIDYMFKRNPRIAPGDFQTVINKVIGTIGTLQSHHKYLKVSHLFLYLFLQYLKFYLVF